MLQKPQAGRVRILTFTVTKGGKKEKSGEGDREGRAGAEPRRPGGAPGRPARAFSPSSRGRAAATAPGWSELGAGGDDAQPRRLGPALRGRRRQRSGPRRPRADLRLARGARGAGWGGGRARPAAAAAQAPDAGRGSAAEEEREEEEDREKERKEEEEEEEGRRGGAPVAVSGQQRRGMPPARESGLSSAGPWGPAR
ncbi:octapeptide-repeat protein T2-like [Oryctolagus cuniculus]|uniref:octapeptide-repeat protein T2-like n=1 Tax=Oryctolagus cuniculus TaxID=9986 RepID=UPI003879A647